MHKLAVILLVVASLVASSLAYPKPAEDGNKTSGKSYDEFTSVLDRESNEDVLENQVGNGRRQFSAESMTEALVRTKRARGRSGTHQVTPKGCRGGFTLQNGKCRQVVASPQRRNPKQG